MNNIKLSLEMWGNWARCKIGTEYSSINVTFQHVLPSAYKSGIRLNDEEGMVVDAAVARLRQYDVLAFKLIIAHYVFHISQNRLAKELGKVQSYVTGLLRIAEAFIAGQLYFYTEKTSVGS